MDNYSESERIIRSLYKITSAYDQGFDFQLQALLKMGLERFNLDIAILSQIDGECYSIVQCICPDDVQIEAGDCFELGKTYCSVTSHAGGPIAIENVGQSDELGHHPAYRELQLESYIGIPVYCRGKLFGTLNFSSAAPYPRQFKDIDIDSLQLMASWIEVELLRRQQEAELQSLNRKLQEQARTDSLTKLPNRRSLFKHLRKEVKRINQNASKSTLVVIDIDHFKKINDQYGHQHGDKTLVAIAGTLREALRSDDFVARYGGEEFVLWLPETKPEQIDDICERIMAGIKALHITAKPITVSMGICHFDCSGEYQNSIDTLLDMLISHADKALYLAKQNGRNRYEKCSLHIDGITFSGEQDRCSFH
ncbi:sensor domain-containing diguanylate cyclase [Photobacterium sp. SDRW27]|uniref:sensor domain-containing diguanylate cyclase n=1 Tax=Photobacterium obscurum TaxID=2829490 RepID=UPI002244569F|nr:sensor domain-containing diguanylate cyclase [Photobacterium obscurum]MCW8331586.1 sensor domain-containing diguanylate cyclase [Photobacterium obscurum]